MSKSISLYEPGDITVGKTSKEKQVGAETLVLGRAPALSRPQHGSKQHVGFRLEHP